MQDRDYFFILGRNSALSVAEILAFLQREQVQYRIIEQSSEVLILQTNADVARLFPELGGSIKFGEVIGEYRDGFDFITHLNSSAGPFVSHGSKDPGSTEKNIRNSHAALFAKRLPADPRPTEGGKVFFGFSIYRLRDDVTEAAIKKFQNYLRSVAMEIKKAVSLGGGRSRFVTGKSHELSSVIVKTNKLLTSGAEFIFFLPPPQSHSLDCGTVVLVGKTLAVQDFVEYERRDYGRPKRNIMRGMLPPKIAKMMINLSGAKKDGALLDPFCGEGTVLAEAAVLGYKNLFGFDVDEKAVEDSRINLEWIAKQYPRNEPEFRVAPAAEVRARATLNHNIRRGDVRELASFLSENSVDAIITEPYLGPLIRGQAEEKEVLEKKEELERLYAAAFKNFTKILKPDGRVVFIFPVWRTRLNSPPLQGGDKRGGLIFIDLDRVLSTNFKVQKLLPTDFTSLDISPRGGIIWQRPDQKVLREIMVLRRDN